MEVQPTGLFENTHRPSTYNCILSWGVHDPKAYVMTTKAPVI